MFSPNKYRVFLSVVTHPFHAGAAAKPPGAGLGAAGQAQADNGEARVAVGSNMCGHPYPDHDCRRLYVCRGECGKYPLQASVPVRTCSCAWSVVFSLAAPARPNASACPAACARTCGDSTSVDASASRSVQTHTLAEKRKFPVCGSPSLSCPSSSCPARVLAHRSLNPKP